jgi:serine/threonine-protein kinase HipA
MMVSEAQIPQALHTFYQMLVISVVLGNGDAHLKNFGMMYRGTSQEDDVWLAPTYDIVTTRVYLPKDSMALLLGGSKRWPSSDNLVRFGRIHCQLNDHQIKQIHDRVRDGVQQAANAMNIYSKQRKSFSAMAEQMKKNLA